MLGLITGLAATFHMRLDSLAIGIVRVTRRAGNISTKLCGDAQRLVLAGQLQHAKQFGQFLRLTELQLKVVVLVRADAVGTSGLFEDAL